MFVKPADGVLVPDPAALHPLPRWLPPEGREVPDTEYWRRRLADGDVAPATPPKPDPPKPGKE